MIAACGIRPEQIDSYHFGFVLGPCINATGRLDTARRAFSLFTTGNAEEAEVIAGELVALNEERKEMTLAGVREAKCLMEKGGYEKDPVLVLYLPEVHESIAGLIAGRIREAYSRPTFILTRGEEGVKGSGRSTEEYSMYEQMCKCSELFTRFGGHPMAAGLSLPEENVALFRQKINETCPCTLEELEPKIHIDMQMPVGYVTPELVHEFSCLAPYGKDNPKPIFADRNLRISRMWTVGKNQNVLRLSMCSEYGQPLSVVYFGDISEFETYITSQFGQDALLRARQGRDNAIRLAMVYVPKIDTYRDSESLQFEMKYYHC